MITVRVDRNAEGRITGFTINGHAGSGPRGFDLVCAGVSAVSFGALNAVDELTGVPMEVRKSPDGGHLSCWLSGAADDGAASAKAELILEAMLVSLRTIAVTYGKFIRLIDKGGRQPC
ncbi:MAG: ribosomal-processing cysteine protease Prp [Sporolactobacillus sp.]|jgi:uncharacterized protein YsxB (DUF464 family)|nr:ribosomal-processing cysteine protease Prp [Sporolactobacillus sp.]